MNVLLRLLIGMILVTLAQGEPPVYAVFGIRAARKVVAARRAQKAASSSKVDQTNVPKEAGSGDPIVREDGLNGEPAVTRAVS